MIQPTTQHLIIRISKDSLSFAMNCGGEEGICFEPYSVKSGISIAANLREAFKSSNLLRRPCQKTTVLIDSPTLLVPLEDFQSEEMDEQYHMVYPQTEGMALEMSILPSFKNMVVFSMSKDLRTVLCDHFENIKFKPVMSPVWEYLLQRSYGNNNKKLYAYFHDGKMELCSFNRTRFAFANSFEAENAQNALYFILGVWKQIGGQAMADDLYLCGKTSFKDELLREVKQFLGRVFVINPSADFHRAAATKVLNMPLDMMLQLI